jgi:hypothetical protein
MVHSEHGEFEVMKPTTVEQARQALSVGFNQINEKDGMMLV